MMRPKWTLPVQVRRRCRWRWGGSLLRQKHHSCWLADTRLRPPSIQSDTGRSEYLVLSLHIWPAGGANKHFPVYYRSFYTPNAFLSQNLISYLNIFVKSAEMILELNKYARSRCSRLGEVEHRGLTPHRWYHHLGNQVYIHTWKHTQQIHWITSRAMRSSLTSFPVLPPTGHPFLWSRSQVTGEPRQTCSTTTKNTEGCLR